MSNKTDEFDSGGLSLACKLPTMEQIQELIGNHPSASLAVSDAVSDRQFGSWRQPRAVNHKYCDSCGESGDLMCCDKCPASFHLECLDPPMAEEDAPTTGEFICKRCTSLSSSKPFGSRGGRQQDDEATSTCSNTSAGSGPSTSLALNKKRRVKKAAPGDVLMPALRPEHDEVFVPTSASSFQNAFQMLLFAAKYTNPKEFELDKGLCINDKIPETYKSDAERKTKGIIEMENGIVPLPMKFCHVCKRTCQTAPLLQCDFCPLLFHLDCLDPPLATFPPRTDRWMCPVHAEHAIDSHLLTSSRLSERIRLWDEFARRSDHDTQPHQVKMRFLRRATLQRHRRQMLGAAQHAKPKVKVQVPSGVKLLYKNPPMLLPRLGDFVDTSVASERREIKRENNLSEQEKDTWLRAVLKFNVDALDHFKTENGLSSSSTPPVNCIKKELRENAVNGDLEDSLQREVDDSDVDVRNLDSQVITALAQRQLNYLLKKRRRKSGERQDMEEETDSQELDCHRSIRLQDGKEVTLTRVPSPSCSRPSAVLSPISGGDSIPLCGRRMTIGTDFNQDMCLLEFGTCNFISPKHAVIFYDKYSRLFELLNYSGHGTSVDSVLYSCNLAAKTSDSPKHKTNRLVRSLANLLDVPVESLRRNRRREKVVVNSATVHDSHSSVDAALPNSNDAEQEVATGVKVEKMESEPSATSCACSSTPSSILGPEGHAGGLEGSAVLHHGSVLKFGCLQFVFAVVDADLVSLPT